MTTSSELPTPAPPTPDDHAQPLSSTHSLQVDRCIHELIAAQAARTPEAIAVVCGHDELSYQALDQRATALAHVLRAHGVAAESLVALCLPRALDLVVALLAVLKAGAAYLPLDPTHPPARLAAILADAQPQLILSTAAVASQLPAADVPVLDLQPPLPAVEPRPLPAVDPDQLAYVIATSGSTGTPKGVQIQHRSLAAHSLAVAQHYGLQPDDRVLQFASLSFDVAAEELFPTWLAGATVMLFPQRDTVSLLEFLQEVALDRITVLNLPASYWHSWIVELARVGAQLPPTLRLMIVGSEEVTPQALELWRSLGGDRVLWSNAYGTSETTITSTIYGPTPAPVAHDAVPIGQPIAGTEVYVLDAELQPVAGGAWGELYLGGAGLARGYLKRPDLTAAAFVPHPFSRRVPSGPGTRPGARLYRTGDRARVRADGQLEFGGRTDRQVKLRGYRIELGEIQTVLRQHPAIAAAVVLRREDAPGVPQLVAYVVEKQKNKRTKEQRDTVTPPSPIAIGEGSQGDEGLSAASLRQWLQHQLPRYMIPSAFVFLDALPLTLNGKIDERALPAPDARPFATPGSLETPLERAVARIWAAVLGVEPHDPADNFFELGGHSLKATQMIARIREQFQVELPLHAILGAPTLAEIALLIEERRADAGSAPQAAIPRVERDRPLPLSFSQERVWFLNELSPGNTAYNTQVTIRFTGPLNIAVLEQAFGEIIRRHELLRTAFVAEDGQPVQIIHPPYQVSIPVIDLRELPAERREDETARLIDAEFARSFDVRQIPLIRWTMLQLDDQDHLLIQVEHHLIHDGWSLSVLFGEMQTLYLAYGRGESSPLPELPIQFADFTTWQRQWMQDGVAAEQMAYWKRQLAGSSFILELPTDRPRPSVQTYRGSTYSIHLPTELALAVRAFSRREGVTLFMTLLSTFQTLLYHYTGQDDLIVGSGIANRRWQETEPLIGMIINNLMLRARLNGDLTFRELLAQVRAVTLEGYAHQDLPFDKLVEQLHPPRDLSRNPIFQVMFSFHDAAMPDLDFPDLITDLHYAHNRSAKFDLNVIVIPQAEQRIGRSRRDNDDDIMIEWEYNTDLFDEATIVRLVEHYQTLLRAVVADPTTRLAALPLMTEQEQRKLLVDCNAATGETSNACVHELIAAQATLTPEAIAVVCGGDELSYQALDQRATALAQVLLAQGVGTESLVALCLPRALDLVVALLAVLKAGAAYLPLDPTHPPARLAAILADAQPQLILSTAAVASQLPAADVPVLDLQPPLPAVEPRPLPVVDPDQLAYVIATSGSTGTPKGVQIQHRSLTHLLQNLGRQIGLTADDSLLAVTTISFDIAGLEIFLPLMVGMRLVLVDGAMAGDGPHLLERLAVSGATVMQATPATWQLLLDAGWQGDSRLTMLCGGEALPRDLANQLLARGSQLWNVYGPTETTIWSTATRVEPGSGPVPIGRPIGHTEAYVLDAHLRLAPIGVWGELYLGGAGLARGYLKRPDLTAAAFVPHPFSAAPGARLYRTGDRARVRADGQLEFGGRTDRQVKLRGYRIELGEIQAVLRQHPAVAAAVALRREDTPGVPRLVAYVVENKGTKEQTNKEQRTKDSTSALCSPEDLRAFLQNHLPAYMVPATIVLLDALPLSPSGKIDLRALPAPQSIRPDSAGTYIAPQTSVQRWLARLWSQLLGLETIGIDDNFFALGGHSLLAARVVARIRQQFQIDVPLIRVFEAPTIAQLEAAIVQASARVTDSIAAARDELESLAADSLQTVLSADPETLALVRQASDLLEHASGPRPAPAASARSADGLHIQRLSRENGPFPLSFAQQRLWFIHQLDPANPIYNLSRMLQLEGQLDVAALHQSLNAVVARHEILRTTFTAVDGVPMQVVADSLSVALPSIDLRSLSEDERDIAVQQHQNDAVATPFDLQHGPLIRAALLRLTDAESLLLLTMHHIVTDEWSINLFIRELATHYEAMQDHQAPESKLLLPELPTQYIDFAVWQRDWLQDQIVETQLGYWQQQLVNLPTLELPLDRPRPPARTFHSAIQPFTIPASTVTALHELRSREGVTLFMTLLTAFKTLLYRYTGQQDIVVGTPITNRPRVELENLIGLFINLLVLRTDLAGDPTFREALRRVRRVAIDAYAHQDLPFERLVSELAPERDVAIMPLFQVLFVLENTNKQPLTLPSLTLREPEVIAKQVTDYDLTLSVTESAEGLAGVFQYNTDLFDAATIQRLAEHFQQVLHSLSNPDQPISTIPLLTATERRRLLYDWNATAASLPLDQSLVQLVETQARQQPEAPAVIGQQQRLSYGDLNRRANRVAHLLQTLGVGPETVVAVCLPRSPELLVAILGVLKAGGAFLPIDPSYPPARREWMLKDSTATALITLQSLRNQPGVPIHTICLDQDTAQIEAAGSVDPNVAIAPENLAYIIYTSGSTGTPKGVPVTHAGLLNLLHWHRQTYAITAADRATHLAGLSFDAAVWEVWPYLAFGASVYLVDDETRVAPDKLRDWLRAHAITHTFLPTPLAEALLALPLTDLPALKAVLTGGEQLHRYPDAGVSFDLMNHYGPTETTVVASSTHVQSQPEPAALPPIGRPIGNTQMYILDRRLNPVPVGVKGELYIGGAGVARGYLHHPALTATQFIPDPFSQQNGARLYRTGDLARYLSDGTIQFLGRIDRQVKVRGFRIELGEIESVLAQHPDVGQAAVVAYEAAQPGQSADTWLVAYVVEEPRIKNLEPRAEQKNKETREQTEISSTLLPPSPTAVGEGGKGGEGLVTKLRAFLKERLPEYLVPSTIILLDALPLTANGKVDRNALPRPDRSRVEATPELVGPRNPVEEVVLDMWSQVLGTRQLGVHDHFFRLGGHSLLATQIVARIRQVLHVDLPVQSVFHAPTIAQLAALIVERETRPGQVEKIARLLQEIKRMPAEDLKKMLQQKQDT